MPKKIKNISALLIVGVAALLFGIKFFNPGDVSTPPEHSWEFLQIEEQADGIPRVSVQLWVQDKPRTVGTFEGSCATSYEDLLPGETEKVVCWYAGGGTEIGLFSEGGRFVVKRGDVDEGSAEVPGFRGNFNTLFEL